MLTGSDAIGAEIPANGWPETHLSRATRPHTIFDVRARDPVRENAPMEPVIRMIGDQPVEFTKARRSHIDGRECVHFGSANGMVYLYESDNPDVVLTTTARKWRVFAEAVAQGEFQVGN